MDPARLLAALLVVGVVAGTAQAECVDQELAEKAAFKRERRNRRG